MRQEAERCLKIEDEKGLQAIERRADDLYYKHAFKTDSHWIGFVEYLKIHYLTASDPIMYQDYLKRAEECLLRGDLEGVRSFGYKAYRYLPQDKAKENRFHDAGLRQ